MGPVAAEALRTFGAMRVALIDCGTNTFHLVVAESDGGGLPKVLHADSVPVMLGETLFVNGSLSAEAMDRGLAALTRFAAAAKAYLPDRVMAYGTAAFRHARNTADFCAAVVAATGIRPVVIDGATEARLIGYGVRQSLPGADTPVLIMDIGGGSTEFIASRGGDVLLSDSFPIGATLLRQRCVTGDPIAPGDGNRLEAYIGSVLDDFLARAKAAGAADHLVGSAGSFDTFRSLSAWMTTGREPPGDEIAADLPLPVFHDLHRTLLRSTHAERLAMPGMAPFRADTIGVASILVTFVLHRLSVQRITGSAYSLKEGMLYAVLHGGNILKPDSPHA